MPSEILLRLVAAAILFLALLVPLGAALRRLPPELRDRLAEARRGAPAADPELARRAAEAGLAAALATRLRPLAFLGHALLLGLCGVAAVLSVWVLAEPGRAAALIADPGPFSNLSFAFVSSEALGLLLLIWIAAAVETPLAPRAAAAPRLLWLDPALRLLLLVPVTAGVFVAYAWTVGAFGGEARGALAAVPGSLGLALAAANLSAVHVWAALISGTPLLLGPALGRAARGGGAAPGMLPAVLALGLWAAGLAAAVLLALLRG